MVVVSNRKVLHRSDLLYFIPFFPLSSLCIAALFNAFSSLCFFLYVQYFLHVALSCLRLNLLNLFVFFLPQTTSCCPLLFPLFHHLPVQKKRACLPIIRPLHVWFLFLFSSDLLVISLWFSLFICASEVVSLSRKVCIMTSHQWPKILNLLNLQLCFSTLTVCYI